MRVCSRIGIGLISSPVRRLNSLPAPRIYSQWITASQPYGRIHFIHTSSSKHSHQQASRPRLRFRPVAAFAALLLAQLYVIWDVSRNTELFETGNSGKFLSNTQFLPYTILKKDVISTNSCILTLRPGISTTAVQDCSGNILDSWRFRFHRALGRAPALTTQDIFNLRQYQECLWKEGIWSIEIKQPQMSITRQYTPLPPDFIQSSPTNATFPTSPNDHSRDPGVFRLFIRREPEGEVSRYLYGLPEGATIELRGGHVDYEIPADVGQLTFVAGGTGIAPALAVAYGFALKQADVDVRILWANRRREDCAGGFCTSHQKSEGILQSLTRKIRTDRTAPSFNQDNPPPAQQASIVQQLEHLQSQEHLSARPGFPRIDTKYFVDDEGTFIQKRELAEALRISTERQSSSYAKRRLVLVSGPDGFVEHVAGPKLLRQGQELQGPRGGLLAQLDLTGWEVWKL